MSRLGHTYLSLRSEVVNGCGSYRLHSCVQLTAAQSSSEFRVNDECCSPHCGVCDFGSVYKCANLLAYLQEETAGIIIDPVRMCVSVTMKTIH